jgi:hypothetical protein
METMMRKINKARRTQEEMRRQADKIIEDFTNGAQECRAREAVGSEGAFD